MTPFNDTSFSIGIFSAAEPGLVWQYHHTSALLTCSTFGGATAIDADSVYRIGSMSKLLTVYLFLILQGDSLRNDPVIDHLPELAGFGGEGHAVPDWSAITVGDIAGQMAGLNRNYGLVDLSIADNLALPPSLQELLPEGHSGRYSDLRLRQHERNIRAIVATSAPIFPTAWSAVYSNAGFPVLAGVLSRLEGRPFAGLFQEYLIKHLNLTSTSYTVPPAIDSAHDVIPGDPTAVGWDSSMGVFTPSGGNFVSLNDLSKIARAILNSECLSQAQTNRWLKPSSFVDDVHAGVGRPWEIYCLESEALGITIDICTKGGDWGVYDSLFLLIPDYGVGLSILTAPDPTGASFGGVLRNLLPNLLTEPMAHAVDEVAKVQAARNFVGTYSVPSSEGNSSLTITIDEHSALRLTAWKNGGHDIYNDLIGAIKPDLDWRLLPNELYDGGRVGFTSFTSIPRPEALFFGARFSWSDADELNVGNVPLGQLVFDVDEAGVAIRVESLGLRVALERERYLIGYHIYRHLKLVVPEAIAITSIVYASEIFIASRGEKARRLEP